MSGIKDQEQIEELRKRLYSRGVDTEMVERHGLTERKVDVARSWGAPAQQATEQPVSASPEELSPVDSPATGLGDDNHESLDLKQPKPQRRYRTFVLVGSLLIFIFGALFSAAALFLGGNNISSDNITLNIGGASTIGSGETMSVQVGITNQNTVGIEGATLVVKYPNGSRTVTEPIKNVYEERTDIGSLAPGEVKNIPLQVAVFGKENDQKEINVTLEYRLSGSDGTFYKEAEPLKFLIVTSPLILQVSSIEKVAAGQPVEVTLTAKSNASMPLKDILINASYPNGFTYSGSDPSPVYNQNTWLIDELKPGESFKIKIKGSITGLTEEKFGINFSAGAAQTDNQFIVGSLLAEARTEFVIERPFINVDINIAGDADRSVVMRPGEDSQVTIMIKNTLDESVYDMVAEVVPSGNVLNKNSVIADNGYYDSNKGTIRFETANNPDFAQVQPNDTRTLSFSILPNGNLSTASFDIVVNVYARRVAERNAQEQLIGSVTATAKYASAATMVSQVSLMTGPVPPKVGETTKYLVTLVAEAGANNMTNTLVKTSLPSHVTWLEDYNGPGVVDYNPISKQLIWDAGDIAGGTRKELVFSVSILPSVSQLGINPILVNRQDLEATDRFTNTSLKAYANPLTTELSSEAGYEPGNGRVIQ